MRNKSEKQQIVSNNPELLLCENGDFKIDKSLVAKYEIIDMHCHLYNGLSQLFPTILQQEKYNDKKSLMDMSCFPFSMRLFDLGKIYFTGCPAKLCTIDGMKARIKLFSGALVLNYATEERLLKDMDANNIQKAVVQQNVIYENLLLKKINYLFCKGTRVFWLAFIAILPILGVLTILLILFGQQPDSIILAFTKTSDWILSGEIAPPPVAYDTHYLCTVSLRGHKKLVKPTRFGIRRGEKIVVNRQLCVANAFEQLIEERTPRFHRGVRAFYDTYGYPVSKHINSVWSADVVYLMMKPLEWIFVFVLYLFDEKPEDRICIQYLPKGKIA